MYTLAENSRPSIVNSADGRFTHVGGEVQVCVQAFGPRPSAPVGLVPMTRPTMIEILKTISGAGIDVGEYDLCLDGSLSIEASERSVRKIQGLGFWCLAADIDAAGITIYRLASTPQF